MAWDDHNRWKDIATPLNAPDRADRGRVATYTDHCGLGLASDSGVYMFGGDIQSPHGGMGRYSNLLSSSNVFADTPWAVASGSITRTSLNATGPDGSQSASTLQWNTAGSVLRRNTTLTNGATYTFSVWVRLSNDVSGGKLSFLAGGGTGVDVVATSEWTRLWATLTAGTSDWVDITHAGQSGFQVFGAQLETGSAPGVYVRTVSAVSTPGYGLVNNGPGPHVFQQGKVGIGTSSPATPLHVVGDVTVASGGVTVSAGDVVIDGITLRHASSALGFSYGGTNFVVVEGSLKTMSVGTSAVSTTAALNVVQSQTGSSEALLANFSGVTSPGTSHYWLRLVDQNNDHGGLRGDGSDRGVQLVSEGPLELRSGTSSNLQLNSGSNYILAGCNNFAVYDEAFSHYGFATDTERERGRWVDSGRQRRWGVGPELPVRHVHLGRRLRPRDADPQRPGSGRQDLRDAAIQRRQHA